MHLRPASVTFLALLAMAMLPAIGLGQTAPLPPPPAPAVRIAPALAPTTRPAVQAGPVGFGLQDVGAYERCIGHAQTAPAAAFEEAQNWRTRGGGDQARHCAALAMLHGGAAELAGEELEKLAQDMRSKSPVLRAEILAQAARAWLTADDLPRARQAANAALLLNPGSAEIWIDRAEMLAAAGNYWEAVDDLNRALEIDPRRAEALVFRASAYRHLDAVDLAREDIDRAMKVAPRLAEAWLERGILNRMKGDMPAARRDWLQVLVLDPEGPAGDAARDNIERLEFKLEPATAAPRAPRR